MACMAAKKPEKRAKAQKPVSRAAIIISVFVAAFLLLSIGSVAMPDFTCAMFDNGKTGYFVWLPKNVTDHFSGDIVNLHFILPYGNTLDVYGTVKEREISPLSCGAPYGHDYAVSMTWREALALTGSGQPIRDFVRMWDDGKIIVVPNGAGNMEKLQSARATLLNYENEPVPENIQRSFDKYRANVSS